MSTELKLALDWDVANRHYDKDGRLHIRVSNISKATVNPYLGREIPNGESMGLVADRVYNLLRDPAELAAAAATSNNIQLLSIHIGVSADDPKKETTVGTTGESAEFVAPFLRNSLAVWDAEAIRGIETNQQRELSCSYRYRADMTPGEYEGLKYDGIMRDIIFNHVALVTAGRAGPEVLVGDSKLEVRQMATLNSRKALMVRGALVALSPVVLAKDHGLAFDSILGGVTRETYKDQKAVIIAALKPKLADDSKLAVLKLALDGMDDEEDGAKDDAIEAEDEMEDIDAEDEAAEAAEKAASDKKARDKRAKDKKARDAKRAKDAPDPEAGTPRDPAMDKKAMDAAVDAAVARVNGIHDAKARVRPYVGEITAAMDSADAVHKFALDKLGVDVTGVHPSAYGAILDAQPKPGSAPRKTPLANDSKADDFLTRFADAGLIGRA